MANFDQFIYNIVSMNNIPQMMYETNIFIEQSYEYDDFQSETEDESQEKENLLFMKFIL